MFGLNQAVSTHGVCGSVDKPSRPAAAGACHGAAQSGADASCRALLDRGCADRLSYVIDLLGRTRVGLTDGIRSPFGDDFINYWSAASLALHGRAAEVYDFVAF